MGKRKLADLSTLPDHLLQKNSPILLLTLRSQLQSWATAFAAVQTGAGGSMMNTELKGFKGRLGNTNCDYGLGDWVIF